MEDCDVTMMAAAVFLISKPSKKVTKIVRRYHVRHSIKVREIYSAEDNTHPVTKEVTVCGYFKNFLRISCENFKWPSNELGPHIGKSNTSFRQAIGVNTKLAYNNYLFFEHRVHRWYPCSTYTFMAHPFNYICTMY